MPVKVFDFEHEIDLENAINDFITDKDIINIQYQTCHFQSLDEQIYSFSALVFYDRK